MTLEEIMAMFNAGTPVPGGQATGYTSTGESGSYAPTGWQTDPNVRTNGENAIVFDPATGQYILAPSAGFNGSGGWDPGRAFTQYIGNPDGTVTTQEQATQGDWATFRPGLLAALGVAGAGALAGGAAGGAAAGGAAETGASVVPWADVGTNAGVAADAAAGSAYTGAYGTGAYTGAGAGATGAGTTGGLFGDVAASSAAPAASSATPAASGGMFSNAVAGGLPEAYGTSGSTALTSGLQGAGSFGTSAPTATGLTGLIGSGLSGIAGGNGSTDYSKYLPAALGAAAGALGSGDKTATTQNTIDPAQRAYLQDFQQRAGAVADQPYQAPGFSLTNGPTSAQTAGQTALEQAMGSPYSAMINQTLGSFMDNSRGGTAAVNPYAGGSNPYLDPMIDASSADMTRAYNTLAAPSFAGGSSFGNSGLADKELLARNDLLKQIGNMSTGLRFNDYTLQAQLGESAAGRQDTMFNNNSNRSLTAAGLGQQGVRDQANMANGLFGMGTSLWGQNQQNTANQYQEFLRQQDWSKNQLAAMNPGLGVNMGSSQSQTTPGNPWAGAVGGAVLGARVGSLFG